MLMLILLLWLVLGLITHVFNHTTALLTTTLHRVGARRNRLELLSMLLMERITDFIDHVANDFIKNTVNLTRKVRKISTGVPKSIIVTSRLRRRLGDRRN